MAAIIWSISQENCLRFLRNCVYSFQQRRPLRLMRINQLPGSIDPRNIKFLQLAEAGSLEVGRDKGTPITAQPEEASQPPLFFRAAGNRRAL
ncbi:MAG: hypothetical protein WCF79_00275, partial [Rhodomicrobium sp.]